MNPPRVFISYSHDSSEHKEWVLGIATTLRERGADIVLDQWDLSPGDDLPNFMETQVEHCDYVIMICTEKYVEKANAGEGGVGYEKMIMTSSLLQKIDSNKIIPIIRQNGSSLRPTFMQSKIYIDFSNDQDIEYNLDDLLRTILNAPLYKKPDIGSKPFKPLEESKPDRTSDGVYETMNAVAKAYDRSNEDYVLYRDVKAACSMHRLTLDRYLDLAKKEGLIDRLAHNVIKLTKKGSDYLVAKGIIQP